MACVSAGRSGLPKKVGPKGVPVVGERWGRLVIIEDAGRDGSVKNHRLIKCRCDCGVEKIIKFSNLGRNTNSCGCLRDEDVSQRSTRPLADVAANKVYFSCTRRCRSKGWAIDLTKADVKELVFADQCFYCERKREDCGVHWKRRDQKLQREMVRLGIDRKDSSVGYLKTNCVPCCFDCNSIKLDRSSALLLTILPKMLTRLTRLQGVL